MSAAKPDWDPRQYLHFADERLRPAIDLAARIGHPGPRRVIDLGCGTGNALPVLSARFPNAELVGVDSSPAMLEKANSAGFTTQLADIATWSPPQPVDVIFSNAALQWLPDHAALFPRLLACLAPGGILAVQMPAMHNEPVRALQSAIALSGPWSKQLSGVTSAPPVLEPAAYYDLLSERVCAVEIWITQYLHVLRGEDPVVQWAMGTSLRPYLDALRPGDRPEFIAAYSKALRPHYPPRADGTVLLAFRRLFILARKQ
ncbi:MAG: methyltransferase domain-containing protein [Deltaproteobacteria bacterium]|nr:methyltransferase domain-containing protein [Deltaproteobacteria bacterium]